MSNRIDEVEKFFKPVKTLSVLTNLLFYSSALFSIAVPIVSDLVNESIFQYVSIVFVILVVLHSFSLNINSFYLLPRAERERRKQLLSDSLGVPLTHSQTSEYYNNEKIFGLERLSTNLMENAFFGKNICVAMVNPERLKVAVYAILLLFSLLSRETDLSVIIALTQIFFAGGVLFSWIKLEILRMKNEQIYDSLYSLHLNQHEAFNVNEMATLLYTFAEYECAKSSASIKLSSRVFHKLNAALTEEWETIKRTISL